MLMLDREDIEQLRQCSRTQGLKISEQSLQKLLNLGLVRQTLGGYAITDEGSRELRKKR